MLLKWQDLEVAVKAALGGNGGSGKQADKMGDVISAPRNLESCPGVIAHLFGSATRS